MMRLVHLRGRVPRRALFAAAGFVQIALIVGLVIDRAAILHLGTEVILQTRPIDPRDFLRGDFVSLSYSISRMSANELWDKPSKGRNTPIYVKLAPMVDGAYTAVAVADQPMAVRGGEVIMLGRATKGVECGPDRRHFCRNELLTINYGIERYFVPEGEGQAIERARGGRLTVVAAVTPSGRAAIKRLLIDGQPVYDEPLF